MLYLILLIFFLIQFLVVLGALIFVIFLARPEVPLLGDGPQKKPALADHVQLSPDPAEGKLLSSGNNALKGIFDSAFTTSYPLLR